MQDTIDLGLRATLRSTGSLLPAVPSPELLVKQDTKMEVVVEAPATTEPEVEMEQMGCLLAMPFAPLVSKCSNLGFQRGNMQRTL